MSKGFEPRVSRRHIEDSKYRREKHENPSFTLDSLPSSLPLQGKWGLATHPLSYHPRRLFGKQENETK